MIRRLIHTMLREGQPVPASGNVIIKQNDNNTPSFEGILLKPKENGVIIEKKNAHMPFMFLYAGGIVPYDFYKSPPA